MGIERRNERRGRNEKGRRGMLMWIYSMEIVNDSLWDSSPVNFISTRKQQS